MAKAILDAVILIMVLMAGDKRKPQAVSVNSPVFCQGLKKY
jgi:hypothetical protein